MYLEIDRSTDNQKIPGFYKQTPKGLFLPFLTWAASPAGFRHIFLLWHHMSKTESSGYHSRAALETLASRGVEIPDPDKVSIGLAVPLENIAAGVTLHPLTRITGAQSRIDAGAQIGTGGAVTLENSQVGAQSVIGSLGPVTLRDTTCGPRTVLGCGVAEQSVFLGREGPEPAFATGYGFRVRKGTLYEECANSAQHTDTKMTILQPFVTLGSNINWCDVLVGGGSGAELGEFSEVGSGAVHFNFTLRGDKATASMFGNVCDGVFLNQPRIFLGGNTSMIGPVSSDFGALTGAGGRHTGHLKGGLNPPLPPPDDAQARDFQLDAYGSIKRIVDSQVLYLGELAALEAWYTTIRIGLLGSSHPDRKQLYEKGRDMVRMNRGERIAQLGRLAHSMAGSATTLEKKHPGDPRIAQQRALLDGWPVLEQHLKKEPARNDPPQALVEALARAAEQADTYTATIRALPPTLAQLGATWLREISTQMASPEILGKVPPLSSQ